MEPRARTYLMIAVLVPLLFGSGPCYCDVHDECDVCGAIGCEDDNVTECNCGDGGNALLSLEDCSQSGLSCTVIRSAAREGEVLDRGFAMCMEACGSPGAVECRRGSDGLTWEVCHSAACGLEEPGGTPDAACLEDLRERVRAQLAGEPESPVPASSDGLRWLRTGIPCDECASSCACAVGFDCRQGHCVAGDADRDLVCCGRERLAPCADGARCERLDGTEGVCETVGRCAGCASDADCAEDRCIDDIGQLPAVCLSASEALAVEERCRPERGAVWRQDACERWVAEVEVCREGFYCDDEEGACLPESPSIRVDPSALTFAETQVGQEAVGSIDITNDGRATLVISEMGVQGRDASQFSVDLTSAEVPVGESLTVEVTFFPTLAGAFEAALAIRSNDFERPALSLPLAGEAVR